MARREINGEARSPYTFFSLTVYTIPILMLVACILSFYKIIHFPLIKGFYLKDKKEFPSLNVVAYLYVHYRYKFPVLHIETTDTNNYFSTSFRTFAKDNSGIPYILQKMILEGSKKYPVPNILSELHKRSFATIMDSFATNEYTTYEYATISQNDFHNLLDVYLDLVFNPAFDEITFANVGHRLEFERIDFYETPLKHKGKVYKQVQEEMNEAENLFRIGQRQAMYPDSISGNYARGITQEIEKLTFEAIKHYYQRMYHPKNVLFFHYGSFPIEPILAKISSYANQFSNIEMESFENLLTQPIWDSSRDKTVFGPLNEYEDSTKIKAAVSWLAGDMRNISDIIDLEFLSILLTNSTLSTLYRSLIKTGIGSQLIETGFFPYSRSPYFSIGVSNFDPTFNKFNITILALLKQIYKTGFEKEHVYSLLNHHEISHKTITNQFGSKLFRNIICSWIHGVDPFTLLDSSWEIERLQRLLAVQPRYFELLMKQKLIDNPHRLDFSMIGKYDYIQDKEKKEASKLINIAYSLPHEKKEEIIQISKSVEERNMKKKDFSCLPSLKVTDLEATQKKPILHTYGNISTYETNSNGIVYINIKAEIPLTNEFMLNVPLFTSLLPFLGAGNLDDDKFISQQALFTGGIKCYYKITPSSKDADNIKAFLIIKGSSLSKNADILLDMIEKALLSPRLTNTEQIAALLPLITHRHVERIKANPATFAGRFAAAGTSKASALDELWGGLTAFQRLTRITQSGNWSQVADRLTNVYKYVFLPSKFTVAVHCDEEDRTTIEESLSLLLHKLSVKQTEVISHDLLTEVYEKMKAKSNIHIKTKLYNKFFTAIAFKVYPFSHALSPAYSVAVTIISNEFLLPIIKDKLGAIDIYTRINIYDGSCFITTVKDPDPPFVLSSIESAIESIEKGDFDESMVERAIVQIFSKMDSPFAPSDEGLDFFFDGISYEERQARRSEFFQITKEHIMSVGKALHKIPKRKVIIGMEKDLMIPLGFRNITFDLFDNL